MNMKEALTKNSLLDGCEDNQAGSWTKRHRGEEYEKFTPKSDVRAAYDPRCTQEDYIFPNPAIKPGRGSRVETLPGKQHLKDCEVIKVKEFELNQVWIHRLTAHNPAEGHIHMATDGALYIFSNGKYVAVEEQATATKFLSEKFIRERYGLDETDEERYDRAMKFIL